MSVSVSYICILDRALRALLAMYPRLSLDWEWRLNGGIVLKQHIDRCMETCVLGLLPWKCTL